ncbi:CHAP domain-containing protein [Staphylococcus hyicus]|uniref:CHAP domain-containing protein n=1 Tax=Staphylococcus hyicus TaxID=1284 RepID=UPI00208F5B5E|nr:CHAP domain-containing protein [Staphylococcus hyicus]MCO4329301.1 CHAP domain-containing protein [Staphylococcus hyicus]MCO4331806.1 CHAP domain-containing protein [Staphylococcus hyicus]MCO4335039.1 CHAP domain-containing protein [Staphylococcus hyicus]MCO4335229.1 CHAP domain-containing protein [Staphylococcus hyicus]
MSTYISKCVTTLSTLTILGAIHNDASYASLKADQAQHPHATFHIHQDGTYTYSYGDVRGSKNGYHQSNDDSVSPHQSYAPQPHVHVQSPYPVTPPVHVPSTTVTPQPTPPSSLTKTHDDVLHTATPESKAFKRDAKGFITSINTDTLYEELQILHFNEDALTPDGKPLALGNGKIIDHPIYTSKNNLYTAGQCTWYVFSKRAQAGKTISTFWGDARNWAAKAASEGFTVNKTPKVGAIMQNYEGPYGHVAYVERVNLDGSILISEMNYIAPYITSTRTIPASSVHAHNYIH